MEGNSSSPPDPFPREPISPDLLAWARQTFDEEEFLRDIREIRATGGLRLEDFIGEIEAIVRAK